MSKSMNERDFFNEKEEVKKATTVVLMPRTRGIRCPLVKAH